MTVKLRYLLVFLAIMPVYGQGILEADDGIVIPLPGEFRQLYLGMSFEEARKALDGDGLFAFRGDADISLLPRPNESVIEVAGTSYIKRAFFQFHDEQLFIMIFFMNESLIDHYSIYTTIREKYGPPSWLSPSEAVWLDESRRLSVERPLAVKYIDVEVFEAIKAEGQMEKNWEEMLRSDFLGEF